MAGGNEGKRKWRGDASSCVSSNKKRLSRRVREPKEMVIYIASEKTPHIPEKGVKVVFNEFGGEISTWTSQEGSNLLCHDEIPILKEMASYIASEKTPHNYHEKSVKVDLSKESEGGDDSALIVQDICTKERSKSASTDQ
ncbi:hypothetical protein VNO77_14201 [Canavalia gladiata]|uniref:Uncharacterized protein n=1 Tax=Canavalia gladiata TaxID=3824 RepID=A0AAN9M2H0_CANGL